MSEISSSLIANLISLFDRRENGGLPFYTLDRLATLTESDNDEIIAKALRYLLRKGVIQRKIIVENPHTKCVVKEADDFSELGDPVVDIATGEEILPDPSNISVVFKPSVGVNAKSGCENVGIR